MLAERESIEMEHTGGEQSPDIPRSLSQRLNQRMTSLVQTITIILLASTLATLLARLHWLADLSANLRIQQLLALIVVLVLLLLLRQWKWSAAALLLIALHAPWLTPAIPRQKAQQPGAQVFRITFANVFTANDHRQQIVADVAGQQSDVIVILELSSSLAEDLSDELRRSHPHQILHPEDLGNFGIGLFSAHAIDDHEVFVTDDSIGIISIEASIQGYRLFATHPLPPMSAPGFAARNRHLGSLAERIRDARSREPHRPVILVGDLNVTPWSPIFADFARRSDLRRAIDRVDCRPTWYVFDWFPFGLVLDHAMISSDLLCNQHRVGLNIGSDHRSVTVDILASE